MKKFIKKCLLAVLIPVLCFLPFLYAGIRSGELTDIDKLRKAQNEDHQTVYLGLAYTDPAPYYKYQNTAEKKPRLLTLGTSCVLQLKAGYFTETSYYNAGRGIHNINEFQPFLESLEAAGALPETLILGLDFDFFNDAWNGDLSLPALDLEKPKHAFFSIIKNLTVDYTKKKWQFKALKEAPETHLGLNAIIRNNGFLKDGSYYYGDHYQNPERQDDYQFKNTLYRIENGILRFEYAEQVDPEALACLDQLLAYCTDKNIHVIGFLPPFAPTIVGQMDSMGNRYGYLKEITPACLPIFQRYGYEYYDYMDLQKIGLDDSYFIDGFHGSEAALLKILSSMLENGSALSKYTNSEHLNTLFENRESNLVVRSPE